MTNASAPLDEALEETFPASDPIAVDPVEPMVLYYMPGTCALGVHIALEWAGAPYRLEKVERSELKSPEYLAINPAGVVPTLRNGSRTMTEGAAILLWLARKYPDLAPPRELGEAGQVTFERLLVTITGTLHPRF